MNANAATVRRRRPLHSCSYDRVDCAVAGDACVTAQPQRLDKTYQWEGDKALLLLLLLLRRLLLLLLLLITEINATTTTTMANCDEWIKVTYKSCAVYKCVYVCDQLIIWINFFLFTWLLLFYAKELRELRTLARHKVEWMNATNNWKK